MKTYLILFIHPSAVYRERVVIYIHSFSGWAKINSSAYMIKSFNGIAQLRDELVSRMDNSGSLVVFDITGDAWANYSFSAPVNEWMEKNI